MIVGPSNEHDIQRFEQVNVRINMGEEDQKTYLRVFGRWCLRYWADAMLSSEERMKSDIPS